MDEGELKARLQRDARACERCMTGSREMLNSRWSIVNRQWVGMGMNERIAA